MTSKIIELKQAPVVLVELAEEANFMSLDRYGHIITYSVNGQMELRRVPLFHSCKFVGILSDLTEEQFAECVSKPHFAQIFSKRLGPFYTDYTNQGRSMMSAKYSWDTLLESENVYTENPYEFPTTTDHKYYDEPYDGTGFYQESYSSDMAQWKDAQSRTIDPKRTIILLKK